MQHHLVLRWEIFNITFLAYPYTVCWLIFRDNWLVDYDYMSVYYLKLKRIKEKESSIRVVLVFKAWGCPLDHMYCINSANCNFRSAIIAQRYTCAKGTIRWHILFYCKAYVHGCEVKTAFYSYIFRISFYSYVASIILYMYVFNITVYSYIVNNTLYFVRHR